MTLDVPIRPAGPHDLADLVRLRSGLHSAEEPVVMRMETEAALAREHSATFVAERDGGIVGFIEVGERAYAEGCSSSPVAFIEEWFVDADARGGGIGRALVERCAEWARARGLTEMASDALLENLEGHAAHRAVGFTEVERLVAFRRAL